MLENFNIIKSTAKSPTYSKIDADSAYEDSESSVGQSKASYDTDSDLPQYSPRKRSWLSRHWVALCVHSVLAVANLIIYVSASLKTWDPVHAKTPLNDVSEYESHVFEAIPLRFVNGSLNPAKPTDYGGDRRPALDEAWSKLLQNQNLLLSEADLAGISVDDTAVRATNGSGVFGSLSVYHALHCLERLHHFAYFDDYYSTLTHEEKRVLSYHTDHCLGFLRQYVQCNADTTPYTMHWVQEGLVPAPKLDALKHTCVNWDRIDDWAGERRFVATNDNIQHPLYGNPFGNKDHPALGIVIIDGHHYVTSNGTVLPQS